jgi:2-oxoglutarate ferredoxin oxidoreductase subunit alpha
LLSDLYLANGAEPWKIPDEASLPDISVPFAEPGQPYTAFARDPETLARTLAIPGQEGLEHRIGGLEKDESGMVSNDPENHGEMSRLRAEKIARIAEDLPPVRLHGERTGKVLVLGWGGTYGTLTAAIATLRSEGYAVSNANLRNLNPFPTDLGELLAGFEKVLVPELNDGQLCMMIRARYLVDAIAFPKLKGRPFKVREIRERVLELLND